MDIKSMGKTVIQDIKKKKKQQIRHLLSKANTEKLALKMCEKMKKEIEEIRKKRAGIENLRRDTLAALGISEQESGKPHASGGQEFDLDSQFDQELDIK